MDSRIEKVDELFAAYDKTNSPGCSLAIFRDGEIIYARGYGMANLEHAIPNQPWTRFYLASMSKQFTAMCIALLVEEDRISLEDDIRKTIPEIPYYQTPITIHHLVHHTSGLRDYLTLGFMAGGEDDAGIIFKEALELLCRQKELNFAPGNEYLYSNSGYILLAEIVARVSGMSFRQYLWENILQPLGMKHTHAHDNHREPVPQRAIAYNPTPDGWRIDMPNFDMVGDGGMYSNVEDLFLWDQNFYHNRLGKGRRELLDLLQTPGRLNNGEAITYAFGLSVETYRGLHEVKHSGGYGGYATEMIRYPDQNFSVVILANNGGIRPTDLARNVAEIFLGDNLLTSQARQTPPEPITLRAEALKEKSGVFYSPLMGMALELAENDGALVVHYNEHTIPLVPVNANTFISAAAPFPSKIEFSVDEQENMTAHLTLGSGKPLQFEKIRVFSPSAQDLDAICGCYHSAELDSKCEIYLQDGAPIFKIRQRRERLKPGYREMYYLNRGAVTFFRNDEGKVCGLTMQAGRVRNIRFNRLFEIK